MAVDFFSHRSSSFETPGGVHWPKRPKDAVGIPQNPRILAALEKYKCTAKVTHNAYDVINQYGDAVEIPFAATEADWEEAAELVGKHRG